MLVGGDDLQVHLMGDLHGDVIIAAGQRREQEGFLLVGEQVGARVQDPPDLVQRVALAAAVPAGGLLNPGTAAIGSVGDALDNALMESTIGLYKTELIDVERSRSWTGRAEVERETAVWVHWYNAERLYSSIGYTSPTEHEVRYRQNVPSAPEVA